MSEFVKVASKLDIKDEDLKKVVVNGKEICLARIGEEVGAISNICPHQGAELCEGDVNEGCIVCPWHGWTFNYKDGSLAMNPNIKVDSYEVKIEGNDIYIKI